MAETKDDLITAGNIAKELGVSDGKVKKAIKELGLEPAAKRGACSYYDRGAIDKVKTALGFPSGTQLRASTSSAGHSMHQQTG